MVLPLSIKDGNLWIWKSAFDLLISLLARDPPPDVRWAGPQLKFVCEGKYSIELFRDSGEDACIESILVRRDSLAVTHALYKGTSASAAAILSPARSGQ